MKCPKCGKEIANDSQFCEFCGTQIDTSIQSPNRKSSNLSSPIDYENPKRTYIRRIFSILCFAIAIVLSTYRIIGRMSLNARSNQNIVPTFQMPNSPTPIFSQDSEIWCDGIYNEKNALYVSVPDLNREHFRIRFSYKPLSYKGRLTWTDAQYPIVLGRSSRSFAICLLQDKQVHITTHNHKYLYDTGIVYKINEYNNLDIEYNHGTIIVNGVQYYVDIPINDDNVFTSICYSTGNAFKGYIKDIEIYSLD